MAATEPDSMKYYTTNDGYQMAYQEHGSPDLPPLILLHGFTGSSQVFTRQFQPLLQHFHIFAPDLRGHGHSAKPRHGFHVSRLATDLQNLIVNHLHLTAPRAVSCIAGSLGCAILWCYAELFTADVFDGMVWVDQSPMQNYALDGSWGEDVGNRGMNCEAAVRGLKETLRRRPDEAYRGTIAACLAYRSHPMPDVDRVTVGSAEAEEDETFFLNIARQGDAEWYGDLMAEHTALDWRKAIIECFGGRIKNRTRILVVASDRSGCFPAKGPMAAVDFANYYRMNSDKRRAEGVVVNWGGHWCYWEDPAKFNDLVLEFLLRKM